MRWLIGIEPEIVECAPANRIGVLVLCKGFTVPGDGIGSLTHTPWRAAVTLVIKRAVVCPARFLRRRMKADVANVHSGNQRHTEGLDRAIEVLIVERVFVMPHTGTGVSYFVTHKPNAVVAWIGFGLADNRARPGHNRRLHLHRRANG